jgi:Transglutaminase-like superfamily
VSFGDRGLVLRMTSWALLLPVLKHVVRLPRLAELMWRDGMGSPSEAGVERVVRLASLAGRFGSLPRRDNCLEHSLILYRYLSMLNADPHLVAAVQRRDGDMQGHVWVTVDGVPVGAEDVSTFTPVLELGRGGSRINTG